jgi:phosphoribosylanthranilate isomerase
MRLVERTVERPPKAHRAVFRIKICGVTRAEDAEQAAAAGADAVGLNFYAASPRYLTIDQARQVLRAVPAGVARVGVFVNAATELVRSARRQLPLDWIQLHGDEPPDYLAQLDEPAVIKAFRCGRAGLDAVAAYLERCRHGQRLPQAILIDAHVPQQYGGTGRVADWALLAGDRTWALGLPFILAGGLTPENVRTAIAQTRPDAIDTASGVESAPGRKEPARIDRFVRQAKAAFADQRDPDRARSPDPPSAGRRPQRP